MTVELGQFALVLALILATLLFVLPLVGAHRGDARLMAMARPLAAGQFVFVLIAFAILTHAFVTQDFSVAYVAQNSNSKLPWYYRFSAVWGAHEGSLLLWVMILNVWTLAVAVFSRALPAAFVSRVLAVMGFISIGFLSLTLFTSNPFTRHLPALADGNDLNPLLQDPGLIIHPPMLYMGYVGLAVAFAFAVAALIEGRLDTRWVRWARPWTKVAWSFLTLGIALGSWWAYYELGWGGWWFWDPVENAIFMPWLVATALIHSQAVTDKRGSFRGWTLLLAIFAFSLSLMGTFIVRSGVLTSVHAFASDPERGLFVLVFLGLVTGGALTLYALRADKLGESGEAFAPVSRESLILLNNVMLCAAAAMVLLGTLYPLLAEVLGLGKLSIGPPYFATLFVLLMAPAVLMLPLGPFSRWRRDELGTLGRALRIAAIVASLGLLALVFPLFAEDSVMKRVRTAAAIFGFLWIAGGTIAYVVSLARDPARRRALGYGEIAGMCLAHFGVGVFVLGALITDTGSIEKDVRLKPGDSVELNQYTVTFARMNHEEGPNFVADRGEFVVTKGGKEITVLRPAKRLYASGGQIMTEAALSPGFTRDLYIALGEPLGDDGAWAVRVYLKPYVRWIWLGALMMMFGGFVAAADRRYRTVAAISDVPVAAGASPA
jgi:cytochrome c-type biogenesis protein CcmF